MTVGLTSRIVICALLMVAFSAGCAGPRAASNTTTVTGNVGLTATDLPLRPTGVSKVYKGEGGRTIVVAAVLPVDQQRYLLKFSSCGTPWDGKTILHIRHEVAGKGEVFYTMVDGKKWPTLTASSAYWTGGTLYEARSPGGDRAQSMKLMGNGMGADTARTIVREYNEQHGK